MDDGSREPDQSTATPAQTVLTTQIIALALMMGIVFFGVVALFIGMNKQPGDPAIAIIAAVFALFATVAAMFVPSRVAAGRTAQQAIGNIQSAETRERARLAVIYQTRMIITFALLEGAALFNLIAYIIAVQWWSFAIACGLLVMMALSFPTRQRIDGWIRLQLELAEFE